MGLGSRRMWEYVDLRAVYGGLSGVRNDVDVRRPREPDEDRCGYGHAEACYRRARYDVNDVFGDLAAGARHMRPPRFGQDEGYEQQAGHDFDCRVVTEE